MVDMSREEAKEILEEVKTIDDSMYQYSKKYLQALDMAISDMDRVAKLEAENKRLKDGIEKVKAEIAKNEDFIYEPNDYDILPKKVRMMRTGKVLEIINKYLGE